MTGTRQRESAVDRIRERVEEKAARRAAAAAARRPPGRRTADPDRPPAGAPSAAGAARHPRGEARPQIPWAGWKQILKRSWAEHKADNMPIIAGGVAFFGFLSIFPALIAMHLALRPGRHPGDRGPAGRGPVGPAARRAPRRSSRTS